jgi:uncharacterized protein YjgD (DUF1641 family)
LSDQEDALLVKVIKKRFDVFKFIVETTTKSTMEELFKNEDETVQQIIEPVMDNFVFTYENE